MNRPGRALIALALCGVALVAAPLFAQQTPPPAQPTKFISPIRGEAEILVMPPVTKVVKGSEVVTTIQVKNASTEPIAGLKVEEFWWDRSGNPTAGGDTKRASKPLMPGEVLTFTLQDVKDASMYRNTYQFSHQYGKIRTKPVKSFAGATTEKKPPTTKKK
jgi:hypothetical protein